MANHPGHTQCSINSYGNSKLCCIVSHHRPNRPCGIARNMASSPRNEERPNFQRRRGTRRLSDVYHLLTNFTRILLSPAFFNAGLGGVVREHGPGGKVRIFVPANRLLHFASHPISSHKLARKHYLIMIKMHIQHDMAARMLKPLALFIQQRASLRRPQDPETERTIPCQHTRIQVYHAAA